MPFMQAIATEGYIVLPNLWIESVVKEIMNRILCVLI